MEKLTSILAVIQDPRDVQPLVDKAAALAVAFHTSLEVLIDHRVAGRAVTEQCSARGFATVTVHSVENAGHQAILQCVRGRHPDLVIKAPAADDGDWLLAAESTAHILLARGETWEHPLRFATAVDVSDEESASLARSILHAAGFLALGTHGQLDILYSEREANDEAVRLKRAVRIAQIVREFHVGCERLQIFSGEPAKRLPPLIAARHYDVLVLGAESSRGAERAIADATRGDVLLVPTPLPAASMPPSAASGHDQRANQV
jgi:hypothetical protein